MPLWDLYVSDSVVDAAVSQVGTPRSAPAGSPDETSPLTRGAIHAGPGALSCRFSRHRGRTPRSWGRTIPDASPARRCVKLATVPDSYGSDSTPVLPKEHEPHD